MESTVTLSRDHQCSFNETVQNSSTWLFKYLYDDLWELGADTRVAEFPLMKGGPWPVVAITIGYLFFVKSLGPRLMKNRHAFDLRRLIFVYNIVMMVVNTYFFASACLYTKFGLRTWGCYNIDVLDRSDQMQWKFTMIWFFLMTKFVDLFETVFFILRKKESQVSFLHVFHHSIVPIDVWVGFKYSPSESACFFPLVNSFVHAIMYFYYALSTLGPRVRPYLWWKRYLTQLQIVQLVFVAIHSVHLVLHPNCDLPKAIFAIYIPQIILLVYLFSAFFMRSYLSPSKASPISDANKRK